MHKRILNNLYHLTVHIYTSPSCGESTEIRVYTPDFIAPYCTSQKGIRRQDANEINEPKENIFNKVIKKKRH